MQKRTLLTLGALAAGVLAVGGGAVTLIEPGLRQARLSASGRDIFNGVASALLDGTLPREPGLRAAALAALAQRIDDLVAMLPAHAQDELSQLLAVLATNVGRRAFARLDAPWTQASVSDVQASLQSMRTSGTRLRQQAYQALHDIVNGAYFSDERTWAALGYPGPAAL